MRMIHKEKYEIDMDYLDNMVGFDELLKSVDTLLNASKEQYGIIKEEAWYKRLWGVITLSRKNEKLMASQIGDLAQAQQILIHLLLRLSDTETCIAEYLSKSYDNIFRLSQQNKEIAQRLVTLERKSIYGITESTDIKNLPKNQKILLEAFINKLAEENKPLNEIQKHYIDNLILYIGNDNNYIVEDFDYEKIRVTNVREHLDCFLRTGLELLFLSNDSFDARAQELAEKLDVGSTTFKETCEQVEKLYIARGNQGFISRYSRVQYDEDADYIPILTEECGINKDNIYYNSVKEIKGLELLNFISLKDRKWASNAHIRSLTCSTDGVYAAISADGKNNYLLRFDETDGLDPIKSFDDNEYLSCCFTNDSKKVLFGGYGGIKKFDIISKSLVSEYKTDFKTVMNDLYCDNENSGRVFASEMSDYLGFLKLLPKKFAYGDITFNTVVAVAGGAIGIAISQLMRYMMKMNRTFLALETDESKAFLWKKIARISNVTSICYGKEHIFIGTGYGHLLILNNYNKYRERVLIDSYILSEDKGLFKDDKASMRYYTNFAATDIGKKKFDFSDVSDDIIKVLSANNIWKPIITSIAVSQDQKLIAVADSKKELHLIDVEHRKRINVIMNKMESAFSCVKFVPDSHMVLAGDIKGNIIAWDWEKDKRINLVSQNKERKTGAIQQMVIHPDGKLFCTGQNGSIAVYKIV